MSLSKNGIRLGRKPRTDTTRKPMQVPQQLHAYVKALAEATGESMIDTMLYNILPRLVAQDAAEQGADHLYDDAFLATGAEAPPDADDDDLFLS